MNKGDQEFGKFFLERIHIMFKKEGGSEFETEEEMMVLGNHFLYL